MTENGATTSTVTQAATTQAVTSSRPEGAPASPLRRAGLGLSGVLLYLLLLDAAVETWLAGSSARWIVAAAVTAYLVLSALLRRRLAGGMRAALSLVVMLALLAFSAWRPAGAHSGIVMLRQAPGTVLTGVTALAILLAVWTLARAAFLPAAVRITAGVLAVYGLAATVWGMVAATPYAALVHGQSLWTRLPFWLQGTFIGGLVLLPAALVVQAGAAIVGRQGGSRRTNLLLAIASAFALVIVAAGFVASRDASGVAGGVAGGVGQNGPGLRPITVAALQLPLPRTPDLAHVEPEHFAAALGKDPARIFEFVRDQVAYEPYAGCLRGPRGTLLALAGNSVDRAALLASLLTAAGHRARFVQGQLPDSRVQDLVASVFVQRPDAGRSEPLPAGAGKAAADMLVAGVKRDGKLLASSLKNAGLPAQADVTSLESLVEETRDHYWVQWWRDGAWVDMDPSFADAAPGTAYARPVATFDALPEALFHRVDIRIRLEEYTGAKPATREILHYSARAADLSGIDLVLAHATERSQGGGGSGLGSFSAGSGAAGQVKPVLIVRGQEVAGSPFWQTAPHKATGAGFESFLGGGEEDAPPVAVAVAEFLQFEFVAPGGRKDSVVREVFDLVGPARRRKGETLAASDVSARTEAAGSHTLTETIYDLFVTTGSLHAAHLENVVSPPAPAEGDLVDVRAGLQRVNILFATTSDVLLNRTTTPEGGVCRFYVDSPRVYIADLSLGPRDMRLSMDLRRDQVRAVGTGVRNEHLFAAQVLRGVVDGVLERVLIDYFASSEGTTNSSPGTAMSTSLVFELAQASNAPIALLDKNATGLTSDVPADGRARVEAALAAGYVALAPKGPVAVAGAPRFAWWQVDRRSGATIAVTDAGLHQDDVEMTLIESKQNGRAVVLYGKAGARNCATPANFENYQAAWRYAKELMDLMKSTGQNYTYTEVWSYFAL
jgi:hypothetical protein